jgi:iron complex outermembrane recepter protein
MIFFLYILLLLPIFGQENVIQSDTLEVFGKKETQEDATNSTKEDPSGFTTIIPIKDSDKKYTSLSEVLEKESGVRVRRYGGLGSYSTLSIRGSNPNQVKIFIDGVPLNNNMGGEINLSDLSFDNLGEIQIYKSGSSAGFSSGSIGGIVNLVTKKQKKEKNTRISVAGGSFHTAKANVSHSNFYESLDYSVFVQKEKSLQKFTFRNDNGTPVFNTIDDFDDKRNNAWFDRYNFTANATYSRENTIFSILNDFNYREHGIPGPGNLQTQDVKRKYIRNTSSVGSDTKSFLFSNFNIKTRTFYTGSSDHLFDPKNEFSFGNSNSKANIQNYGLHVSPEIYLLEYNQILRFLLASERDSFKREVRNKFDELVSREPSKFRNHTGLQIQDEIRFFSKRLIFLPEIQFHQYTDLFNETSTNRNFFTFLNPNKTERKTTNYRMGVLGVLYQSKIRTFSIKGNASSEIRIPDFLELFGERGSIIGNTTLLPEKSKNIDTGFVYNQKDKEYKWNTSLIYFDKSILDMILFVPNSQYTLRPENIDSAKIRGLEFSTSIEAWETWKLKINYTYQKALNTSNIDYVKGKYLPLRPMHELFGGLTYMRSKFETGIETLFIGASFRDRTNEYSNYQEARTIWNYFFTYIVYREIINEKIEKELLVNLDIKNISDVRAFDLVGFPLPGRTFYASLSAKF